MTRTRGEQTSTRSSAKLNSQKAACERCRGQKLRCTWDPKESQCQRCQRADAVCTIPPPRPMGRPPRQLRSRSNSYGRAQSIQNQHAWSADTTSSTAVPRDSSIDYTAMILNPGDFSDSLDLFNPFPDTNGLEWLLSSPMVNNTTLSIPGNMTLGPPNESDVSAFAHFSSTEDDAAVAGKPQDNHVQLLTQLSDLSVELFRHPVYREEYKSASRSNGISDSGSRSSSSTHQPGSDQSSLPSELTLAELGVGNLLDMTCRLRAIVTRIRLLENSEKSPSAEDGDRSTALMALSCYTRLEIIYSRSMDIIDQVLSGSCQIRDIHLLLPELTIDGFCIDRCYDFRLGILVSLYKRAHKRIRTCIQHEAQPSNQSTRKNT